MIRAVLLLAVLVAGASLLAWPSPRAAATC